MSASKNLLNIVKAYQQLFVRICQTSLPHRSDKVYSKIKFRS